MARLHNGSEEVGYDYVLSIEHEDLFFGSEYGLIKGGKYLRELIGA